MVRLLSSLLHTELSACCRVLVLLSLPIVLLNLLWTPGARGNHNKWWTCNDACARCARRVMPMEEMITQMYPGLFSTTPPSNAVSLQDFVDNMNISANGTRDVLTSADGDTGSPVVSGADRVNGSLGTGSAGTSVYVDSISARPLPSPSYAASAGGIGCCETVMEYITPPNVTIGGQVYKVVHLRHMFQFIPIGRCKPGSTCGAGQCVDQFRAHWVLVYNSTRPLQGAAPVSFAPIEVPSHCECLNVGRP